ncbi:hypothetical protein AX279_08695 [Pseudomonas sp. J237]|nr:MULTISPECIES: GGDEF domain-containing protein [Pseudomonas]OEO26861.1 hypothetical protein AX279_08695 [Pseudomonas sp. J237]
MQSNPESRQDDPYDTVFIRRSFRSLVRWGIVILSVINLLHLSLFLSYGSRWWAFSALLILVQAPLYLLVINRRSFPVFIGGLALLILAFGIQLSVYCTQFGARAGFHYLLFAMTPLVAFSGRIRIWHKVVLCLLLMLQMLALEQRTAPDPDISAQALECLRLLNLASAFSVISLFVMRHFMVVAGMNSKLEHMAAYDPLTGMINRRRMAEVAADELDHSFEKHSALSMILADIDHFKLINDRYGHQFGDQALLHVSQTIMQIARDGDSCCRWGGEEFLIMLPVTDLQGARQLAERIRVEVSRNALCLNGHDVGLTLTLGVVELQPHEGLDSAIARADEALYAGKDNGRNQVMLGQPAAQ